MTANASPVATQAHSDHTVVLYNGASYTSIYDCEDHNDRRRHAFASKQIQLIVDASATAQGMSAVDGSKNDRPYPEDAISTSDAHCGKRLLTVHRSTASAFMQLRPPTNRNDLP